MVIILTFLGAICFFLCMMFIGQRQLRAILATVAGIIFIGSTALMTLNYSHHLGMHKVTTTQTKQIYSAADPMPVAIYQPVGTNGKDNVYIYKTSKKQAKPSHTQANEYTHSKIKFTNRTTAQLVTNETRWQYKNDFYKFLFAWSGMDGSLVKRTNTLEYPKAYVKLTTQQAQKLAKLAKSATAKNAQAAGQQQAKSYVAGKVQEALAKNPHMTAPQIQHVTEQAQLEFQSQMIKQLLK